VAESMIPSWGTSEAEAPRQTPPQAPLGAKAPGGVSLHPCPPLGDLGSIQGILGLTPSLASQVSKKLSRLESLRVATDDLVHLRKLQTLERARPLFEYLWHADPRFELGEDRQSRRGEWDRIERCIMNSWPVFRQCGPCGKIHVTLEGSCKGRICPLCRERYGRSRAQVYRDRMGPSEHLASLIITMPPEVHEGWRQGEETKILNLASRALCGFFWPYIPAGLCVLHWAGDGDPMRAHPHFNFIASNRCVDALTGEVYRVLPRVWDLWEIRAVTETVSAALGVPRYRCQGRYRWHATHAKQRHLLRYMLRSQGCGDQVARAKWTLPRARTVRPVGMLVGKRLKEWQALNPWKHPQQKAKALGDLGEDGAPGGEKGPPVLCPSCGRTAQLVL
jgi:hypothetical protein